MKAHYEIMQGTADWLEMRWGKIGGTLSNGLFVKSDTLFYDLLSEQTEDFQLVDHYENSDMLRGTELEPVARENLTKYTEVDFIECGWLQSLSNTILGISPDGISKDETEMCEIKCPAAKKHITTVIENEIPKDHRHQCLHYFTVNPKLKKLHFCSFRPESIRPLFVKTITPDSKLDLGTKSKPNVKTVKEWVVIARDEALIIKIQVEKAIEKLNF